MAKNKSTRKDRRAQARAEAKRTPAHPPRPSGTSKVVLNTAFGPVEVPQAVAQQLANGAPHAGHDGADHTILRLADCEHELTLVSPGLARRALVEAERLDPGVADQLVRDFAFLTPTLMIFGERGRLLAASTTLRRVRRAAIYSGDTHAALMGMIYDMPRVVLAEFENGPAEHGARDELARMFEAWNGTLLVVLVAGRAPEARPIEDGNIIAAHEVDLERPVLWHRGERGRP